MKAVDIKPFTVYKVKMPWGYRDEGHYVQTGSDITPQLLDGKIHDPSGNGHWSSQPKMKDRIYVKPVKWDDEIGEWVFHKDDLHATDYQTHKGEWGQVQLRAILEEATTDEEMQLRQNAEDLDSAPALIEEAIEFYADHLEQLRSAVRLGNEQARTQKTRSHKQNLDDARILREYGKRLVNMGFLRIKFAWHR